MNEIFLTSDTHFCHNQDFVWKARGFSCVEEMNEAIIERWNATVKPQDIVYHLGDTMLNDNEKGIECFKRLNGEIFLIFGNHDTIDRRDKIYMECKDKMRDCWYSFMFKYGKQSIYLSHYPTLTANWDTKHFNQHVINFHGHVHNKKHWLFPDNPFIYDVGVDSNNCTPIHIETAIADVRARWEEIGRLPNSIKPEDLYFSK